jgi:branched-chain amino acid transport system permease protein
MKHNRALSSVGLIAVVILLFGVPSILRSQYWVHVLVLSTITVIMAASLRCLARVGLVSMGSAGFMLVGAYTSALVATKGGLSVWIAMLLGGMVAAALAFAVSIPFLRAKGVYFAILTLMLAEMLRMIVWYWPSLTGGNTGLTGIPKPSAIKLPGLGEIGFDSKANYFYLALVVGIVALVVLYRLERSWFGDMWLSICENDRKAASCGVNVRAHKQLAIVVSSFFMGIAGALYAHYVGVLTPSGDIGSPFGFAASLYLIIYMMVGGEAHFAGPIIGAYLLTIVPEVGRAAQQYMPLLLGAVMLLVVFVFPEGVMGLWTRAGSALRTARTRAEQSVPVTKRREPGE